MGRYPALCRLCALGLYPIPGRGIGCISVNDRIHHPGLHGELIGIIVRLAGLGLVDGGGAGLLSRECASIAGSVGLGGQTAEHQGQRQAREGVTESCRAPWEGKMNGRLAISTTAIYALFIIPIHV